MVALPSLGTQTGGLFSREPCSHSCLRRSSRVRGGGKNRPAFISRLQTLQTAPLAGEMLGAA